MNAIVIASINASAEIPNVPPCSFEQASTDAGDKDFWTNELAPTTSSEAGPTSPEVFDAVVGESDPACGDPTQVVDPPELLGEIVPPALIRDPDLWLYRRRTVGLLRRYLQLSIEVGRMPSLLGREVFRARLTAYKASTFEDSVIFVHDVEVSLDQLDNFQKQLIAKIVLQEYSQEEAGRLLGCGHRHAARCYADALDRVSELFLKRGLLTRLPETKPETPKNLVKGGKGSNSP
jgi:hypothetical protein